MGTVSPTCARLQKSRDARPLGWRPFAAV